MPWLQRKPYPRNWAGEWLAGHRRIDQNHTYGRHAQ